MVSRKSYEEITLLLDERVPYPHIDYLGRPVKQYILHVPLPEKLVPYDFRENQLIKWRVLKACVAHESGHAYLTDPLIYEDWKNDKDKKIARFTINLLEDFRVENFLSSKWTGLGADLVLTNLIAYIRSKPIEVFDDPLKRIMMAIISHTFMNKIKGKITKSERKTIRAVDRIIEKAKWVSKPQMLISAATKIYVKIFEHGESENLRTFPVSPHRDGKPSSEFYRNIVLDANGDLLGTIKRVMRELSIKDSFEDIFEKNALSEVDFVFHREQTSKDKEARILKLYLKNKYNFLSINFPQKDYAEYLRHRKRVFTLTKRVLGVVSQVKTDYAEEPLQRGGMIDLNEAIQAVASETNRDDIFKKLERTAQSSAWAILVDNSESLSVSNETLKKLTICLSEIANGLMPASAWMLHTFSDSMSIIKDFNEKYDKRVHYRLGGIKTGGLTYIPDALKIASKRLLTVPQIYKVLILVTDGHPHGYEGIEEEMIQEIKNVQNRGISLIAIGLENKKAKKYFRNFCYVDNISDLAKNFSRIYLALSQLT
jgi:hypothetical protein